MKDLTGAEKNMATARGAYEVMHKKKDDTKDEYEKVSVVPLSLLSLHGSLLFFPCSLFLFFLLHLSPFAY